MEADLFAFFENFCAKLDFAEASTIQRKNSVASATKSREKKTFYNMEISAFKVTEQHPASIFPS